MKDLSRYIESSDYSTVRQVWETTQFLKHARSLTQDKGSLLPNKFSPDRFLNIFGPGIKKEFNDSRESQLSGEKIPVLVCAHNEISNIGFLLLCLSMQKDVHLQPVIVDNASSDGTGEFAKDLGALVISEPQEGLINALRSGFQFFSDAKYKGPLLLCDADSAPLPEWSKLMLQKAETIPSTEAEIFGPLVFDDPEKPFYTPKNLAVTAGFAYSDLKRKMTRKYPNAHGPNGLIIGNQETFAALSGIENPPGRPYETDRVVARTVSGVGGITQSYLNPRASVITSGRRYPRMRDVVLLKIAPKITNSRLYSDHKS